MEAAPVSPAWEAITAGELHRLYWRQVCSDEEIGLMFGVSRQTVYRKRLALGVPSRRGPTPGLGNRGRRLKPGRLLLK